MFQNVAGMGSDPLSDPADTLPLQLLLTSHFTLHTDLPSHAVQYGRLYYFRIWIVLPPPSYPRTSRRDHFVV